MALQNLQQYGCQTGNKLKEKSCDLNRNSSRNKQEEKLLFFGSVSGCTCLILNKKGYELSNISMPSCIPSNTLSGRHTPCITLGLSSGKHSYW
jgi:hypothetical protein